MFSVKWGIDVRCSLRRIFSPPPPTLSAPVPWVIKAQRLVKEGCGRILGHRSATEKLCRWSRDPNFNESEDNCCVYEVESPGAQFNKLQTAKPPTAAYPGWGFFTSWKTGSEKRYFVCSWHGGSERLWGFIDHLNWVHSNFCRLLQSVLSYYREMWGK